MDNILTAVKDIILMFKTYLFTKRSLYALGLSLPFSIILILLSTPKFLIESKLIETNTFSSPSSNINNVLDIVSGESSSSDAYEKFSSHLFSLETAKKMWDLGWGTKIFFDQNSDEINQIKKKHSLVDRVSALLMRYKLNPYIDYRDLNSYIIGTIKVYKSPRAPDINLSGLFTSTEIGIEFMDDLIMTADLSAKESQLAITNQRSIAIQDALATNQPAIVSNSLVSLLNSDLLTVASLTNDLPYFVTIIDPAHASEYPISPNILAVFIANVILFLFFVNIAFYLRLKNFL
jgi:hypothetical protein